MSTEHGEIDLDEYRELAGSAGVSPSRLAARHRMILRFVAVFVAGVVLGGAVVNQLRDSREQRERGASVSLVAIPASATSMSASSPGRVQLYAQLALINTGAAPITVNAAMAQRPDAHIPDTRLSRRIGPGSTALIDVRVRFECSIPIENEPLPVRFSVKTDDNQDREVNAPVSLVNSAWDLEFRQACVYLR
ncbi:hypothetical protein AB0C02_07540 [Micromonospora sp. NPDC048999]|uniref:hypothetical protein n=1 Tax=Micromonospora sp. NPDC048999 TaxID=3155391 RepID=UPI0033C2701F